MKLTTFIQVLAVLATTSLAAPPPKVASGDVAKGNAAAGAPATVTVTVTVTKTVEASATNAGGAKAAGGKGGNVAAANAKQPKAVYLNLNDPNGNAVLAVPIKADGTLDVKKARKNPTAGIGGIGLTVDAATNKTIDAATDPFFSQGAVQAAGNLVMAVNAGCNTLTLFKSDPKDRTKLTRVGAPQNTLGDFPVSVTFNAKLKTACVLNAGQKDGVACFGVDENKGLRPLDKAVRKINIGQSTPPVGPLGTASHVFFKPDGSALMVTVKGDPTIKKDGFLGAFAVQNGKVSTKLIKSIPDGSAVLFGSTFAGANSNTIVSTDAAFGAVTFDFDAKTLSAASDAKIQKGASVITKVDGQKATCWSSFSAATGTVFATDIGRGRFLEIDPTAKANNEVALVDIEKDGITGMIDLTSGGDFVYAFAPAEQAIVALDVAGGKGKAKLLEVAKGLGLKSSMGMAVSF
ncbi:hypothetical protein HDU97_004930 [Phlyctochytrium planicorne]|nr:hypothetical protein HDU97_004930 [Phlyctochytrium planicorne]